MTKRSGPKSKANFPQHASEQAGPGRFQAVPNPETQGFLRGVISVFILFHLIAITCWALPVDISPMKQVKEIVRPYMIWSGLFQSWDLFAANPKSDNSYVEADVITRNRKKKVWAFPRMVKLGFGERYRKERYRKFAVALPQQSNAYLWSGVAQHIAGMYKSQTDPPQMVVLIEFQAFMKPGPRNAPEPILTPRIFYEYSDVQPQDLK